MAGIRREPGPTEERVRANLRRIRHSVRAITTAAMAERLDAIGHPVADTGITKTEKGGRGVYVDDLVPFALALGVTPNTLLMPEVSYLGSADTHQLTPGVSGTAERLWQWAQGETPVCVPVPGSRSWLGGSAHPALEFSLTSRPYLTALHTGTPTGPGPGGSYPEMRELAEAALNALAKGASGDEVRRVVELAITFPAAGLAREEVVQRLRGRHEGGGQ